MRRQDAMWAMVQFNHFKATNPKQALYWISPVMVAAFKNELDETLEFVFETKIKPEIKRLRKNANLEHYTSFQSVPKLAATVREWLEKEHVEGMKAVVCRQYFNRVFSVTAA